MSVFGDYLWRPGAVFPTVGAWAQARDGAALLRAVPPPASASDVDDTERWQLADLPHGKVVGDLRLVATRANEVLGQLQSLQGIASPETHWTLRQWRWRWPRRLRGRAVVLGAAAGANYYHWLFDSLPRLHLLRRAGWDRDGADWFLLNEADRSFDRDALEWLGIPRERMVRCSKRTVTCAEHLIVPPMPTRQQGEVSPWVCEFLRTSFGVPAKPGAGNVRLYLSRRGTPKRQLANEAAVEAFFQERGFQSVRLEELTFREQVMLFSRADFVAGPHGAGFANLVFAPPHARVLELFHPRHRSTNYQEIARIIGMKYQSLVGAAPDEVEAQLSENLGPFTISLAGLRAAVVALGGD
jgi:capsular polysaccharide biosynthesis protein